MGAADFALGVPSEHARDLVDPAGSLEHGDVRCRNTALRTLGDDDMVMGPGSDLRQMGDGKDLVLLRYSTKGVADLKTDAPTNAGVDFVEYQCRHLVHARQNSLQRQHDA